MKSKKFSGWLCKENPLAAVFHSLLDSFQLGSVCCFFCCVLTFSFLLALRNMATRCFALSRSLSSCFTNAKGLLLTRAPVLVLGGPPSRRPYGKSLYQDDFLGGSFGEDVSSHSALTDGSFHFNVL